MNNEERFRRALERIAKGRDVPESEPSYWKRPGGWAPEDREAEAHSDYAQHVLAGGDPNVTDGYGERAEAKP